MIGFYYLDFPFFFDETFKQLNTPAARAAPTNGATINTQTCFRASPPRNNAGAKLLAGLTDVPVRLIPIK